jgi:hypothetical protein
MSDPKQHQDPDDLDLDAETVRDLEVDGEDVEGGAQRPDPQTSGQTCISCFVCVTGGCVGKP